MAAKYLWICCIILDLSIKDIKQIKCEMAPCIQWTRQEQCIKSILYYILKNGAPEREKKKVFSSSPQWDGFLEVLSVSDLKFLSLVDMKNPNKHGTQWEFKVQKKWNWWPRVDLVWSNAMEVINEWGKPFYL